MEKSPHSTVSGTSNGKAPAAYVTLILDETGSMQDCKGAAIAGINAYLTTLRQMPAPRPKTSMRSKTASGPKKRR